MLLVPVIGWNAARAPVSITRTDFASDHDSATSTTWTFNSQSIGAAVSDRLIIVALLMPYANAYVSATIGGIAATLHQSSNDGDKVSCHLISARVPTGTSATIVVTFSGGFQTTESEIVVYRAINVIDQTPAWSANSATPSGTETSRSLSATVPTGGAGVTAAGVDDDNIDVTWSGVTDPFDTDTSQISLAAGIILASGTVQLTIDRPLEIAMVGATWR